MSPGEPPETLDGALDPGPEGGAEPLSPPRPLHLLRIFGWQSAVAACLMSASASARRGSPLGIAAGACVLSASLLLQAWAIRAALGRQRRPALAVSLFSLKLALLMGVTAYGLYRAGIPPMSFAAGATTLLVAIVIDTCYEDATSSRARG
ncbi:MAG: hypothetical protein ACKOCT_14385 [Alphaproteobacteria bacterium]